MKIVYHDIFASRTGGHLTGEGCPEREDRLEGIEEIIQTARKTKKLVRAKITDTSTRALAETHTQEYIGMIEENSKKLDEGELITIDSSVETYLSRCSFGVAQLAVGAAIQAAQIAQRGETAFAIVRPPGHHAHEDYGHGFCLFNNIAIAAEYLARTYNKNRVLVVDIDIHFGDGTFHILRDSSYAERMYYFSINQSNLFPNERPKRKDAQSTNIFLPAGTDDNQYIKTFSKHFSAVLKEFNPNIIAVSAGFDTCTVDAEIYGETEKMGFHLTRKSYEHIKKLLDNSHIPHFFVLEGGYSSESVKLGIEVFTEDKKQGNL